jgi:hypothetical protein
MNNKASAVHFGSSGVSSPLYLENMFSSVYVLLYMLCGTYACACNEYVYQTLYWPNIICINDGLFLFLGIVDVFTLFPFHSNTSSPWIIHPLG